LQLRPRIPGILVSLPAASLSDIYEGRDSASRWIRLRFCPFSVPASCGLVAAHNRAILSWIRNCNIRACCRSSHSRSVPCKTRRANIALLVSYLRWPNHRANTRRIHTVRNTRPTSPPPSDFHLLYLAVGVAGITANNHGPTIPCLKRKHLKAAQQDDAKKTLARVFKGWGTVATNKGASACRFRSGPHNISSTPRSILLGRVPH